MNSSNSLVNPPSTYTPALELQVRGIGPHSTNTAQIQISPDFDEPNLRLLQPHLEAHGGLTEGQLVEQHAHKMHSYIPSNFFRSS